MPDPEVRERMEQVEKGHIIRWNERVNPQVVTKVTNAGFEVRSHKEKYYHFFHQGQHLVNQQSDNEYDVYDFEIVGEAYDIEGW